MYALDNNAPYMTRIAIKSLRGERKTIDIEGRSTTEIYRRVAEAFGIPETSFWVMLAGERLRPGMTLSESTLAHIASLKNLDIAMKAPMVHSVPAAGHAVEAVPCGDPFISALEITPTSKLDQLKKEVAIDFWGKGGASAPPVSDSIREHAYVGSDAEITAFTSRGGVFVMGPSDAEVVAGSASIGIVIRPGDFVTPVCNEGVNRSQVMHLVLTCLRTAVTPAGASPAFHVGVPHGAEGGYDPWKTDAHVELSNVESSGAWVHRQVFSTILPASHRDAGPVDGIFIRAFGVDRHERAGEALCRAAGRDIAADDYVHDLPTLTADRRGQKQAMETNFFRVAALQRRTAAPDGRVIVIAFSRSARIFLHRLLSSNEASTSFAGIVIVSLPFDDTIKNGSRQALDAFRLYSSIVRYDGKRSAGRLEHAHAEPRRRPIFRGNKSALEMAYAAKETLNMLTEMKGTMATAREAASLDKEIATTSFAYVDWLRNAMIEAKSVLDRDPYNEDAGMAFQTADSELGHFLRHASVGQGGGGDGAASGSSRDAVTYNGGANGAGRGGRRHRITMVSTFLRTHTSFVVLE